VQLRLLDDNVTIRTLVLDFPVSCHFSIEDNIEPNLEWLQPRLNLNAAETRQNVKALS
jgi:hypothetical protein